MPQKGLKKDDGVRGRREEISSKFFPFFPDHKSTFIGTRAYSKNTLCSGGLPFSAANRAGSPVIHMHFTDIKFCRNAG